MADEPQEQAEEQQRQKKPLWGFIASDPELTFTSKGDARFYARIGEPQSRREEDGSYTELEPDFGDLVMYRKSAERAYEKFRKGDNFIAVVEKREYTNSEGEQKEQFVAARIGHDNNTTNYTVDRSRPERNGPEHDTVAREDVQHAREDVQHALAEREAQLQPDDAPPTDGTGVQREAVAR